MFGRECKRTVTVGEDQIQVAEFVHKETAVTGGFCLSVLRSLSTHQNPYFTDNMQTFRHASTKIDPDTGSMVYWLAEEETDQEKVAMLKQAISIWKTTSPLRRALLKRSSHLMELLCSVPRSAFITEFYQTARAIERSVNKVPDVELPALSDAFSELEERLKGAIADDGKPIINPERHLDFLLKLDSY
jgi:hypothetical protein